MLKKFNISTKKDDVYEITADVKQAVEESGVKEGICVVFTPHTTAAIVVTSRMDPDGFEDLRDEVNRLIPTRIDFKHQLQKENCFWVAPRESFSRSLMDREREIIL